LSAQFIVEFTGSWQ